MKPWPAILVELYPLAPWPHGQRHPERPWWHGSGGTSWQRYTPTDTGTTYAADDQAVRDRTTDTADMKRAIEYMRAIDARDPLPHPGIRVGQTWALLNGELNVFTISEYDADHEDNFRVGRALRSVIKPWLRGGSWLAEAEIRDLLGLDGPSEDVNAYLIADQCCPWLAPWSPS